MRLRIEDSNYALPEVAVKIRQVYDSNARFAKVLKTSPAAVSNILQGKSTLNVPKLLLWCRLLGISTDKWEAYFVTQKDRQTVYDHLQGSC